MNWNLLGHEWAVSLLQDHITHNALRHAYLITGPSGLGRRTLALRLAAAINCNQPFAAGEPCGVCRACTRIEAMQHPDLTMVQAEQRGGTLKVEQIRETQHSLALAPYEAPFRTSIFLRFEEAHASAANALLKTLEEPPPQVVLILTASSAEAVLPTIVSRCETLRLRPLSVEVVSRGLEERWGLPHEEARLLAHISGGRPGYALRLQAEPELLQRRGDWLDDLVHLFGSSRVERFAYAEAAAKEKEKEELRELLSVWGSFWRDILLAAARSTNPPTNLDRLEVIQRTASSLGLERARCAVAALERTRERIDLNANTRLALEVLMLDLPLSDG